MSNLFDIAGTVSKRAQIKGVMLVHSEIVRNAADISNVEDIEITHAFKVDAQVHPEDHELSTLVRFVVTGKKAHSDVQEDDLFTVKVSYQLSYETMGDEPFEENSLDVFAKLNGIYNSWAYLREYVQSSLGRMGLPPIVLPLMTASQLEKTISNSIVRSQDKDPAAIEEATS